MKTITYSAIIAAVTLLLFPTHLSAQVMSSSQLSPTSISTIAAGGAPWQSTTNSKVSNNLYSGHDLNATYKKTDYLVATDFTANVPAGATIVGIMVEFEKYNLGATNIRDEEIRIVKNGLIQNEESDANLKNTQNWSKNDNNTYSDYGSNSELWNQTWTADEINAPGFGIAIRGYKISNGASIAKPSIDHIRVTVYYTNSLPIELAYFEAKQSNRGIEVKWETSTEVNHDYFTVERSTDGRMFNPFEKIQGQGNSTQSHYYKAEDTQPVSGTNYYRLKIVDRDGGIEYSDVINTRFDKNSLSTQLAPHPVTDRSVLSFQNFEASLTTVVIYDLSGKVVKQLETHNNDFAIDRQDFIAGSYFYVISNQQGYKDTGKILIK